MFLIYGTRGLTKKLEDGQFYCPQCDADGVGYDLHRSRTWFTLYFIPVFPLGGGDRYVECHRCKGTFKESVLDMRPPTEAERYAREVEYKLERGTSLEAAEAELARLGMTPDDARELVGMLAGAGVWQCPGCGDRYAKPVKRCKACDRRAGG